MSKRSIGERKLRRILSTFDEASDMAYDAGIDLAQRAECHYQLWVYQSHEPLRFWLYNLYPGTQRIYADPHHKGPFLHLPNPWSFLDVVKAAVKLNSKRAR